MRFRTVVEVGGKTATEFSDPDKVVSERGASRRPPVTVTVGDHTYRTAVAPMGGRLLVPLSAENRAAAGIAAGDEVEVDISLDTAPRDVTVPDDLAQALAGDPDARQFFDASSPLAVLAAGVLGDTWGPVCDTTAPASP